MKLLKKSRVSLMNTRQKLKHNLNFAIPSLTYTSFCDTVCVTEGGGTNGEVYIRRNYVWREVQH